LTAKVHGSLLYFIGGPDLAISCWQKLAGLGGGLVPRYRGGTSFAVIGIALIGVASVCNDRNRLDSSTRLQHTEVPTLASWPCAENPRKPRFGRSVEASPCGMSKIRSCSPTPASPQDHRIQQLPKVAPSLDHRHRWPGSPKHRWARE